MAVHVNNVNKFFITMKVIFKSYIWLVFAILPVAGCIQFTLPKEPPPVIVGSQTDYGAYPTNYEYLVKTYIKVFFKDPASVQDLSILKPLPTFLPAHTMLANVWLESHHYPDSAQIYCYDVTFFANAKNGFGGYAGSKPYHIYIRDGQIVDDLDIE